MFAAQRQYCEFSGRNATDLASAEQENAKHSSTSLDTSAADDQEPDDSPPHAPTAAGVDLRSLRGYLDGSCLVRWQGEPWTVALYRASSCRRW